MNDSQSGRPSRKDATREERLEVLRLLEDGDISASEADALLEALDVAEQAGQRPSETLGVASPIRLRNVRVRITDPKSNKPAINVALPIGLFEAGLNVARRFAPEHIPSAESIRQSIQSGATGKLVDIDDANGRVEVIVE